MKRKVADYLNGNVHIQLYSDGTRIMETEADEFEFDRPTNIDLTITKACDGGCPYCYMNCTTEGKLADLSHPILKSLGEYQELAINLNDMNIPDLVPFLQRMKQRHIFVNGTINQVHFLKHWKLLKQLCGKRLLWGIGISLRNPTPEFINTVKGFPNAVIHVINGVLSASDIEKMRDKGLKLLILGYKNLGRGTDYATENSASVVARQRYLKDVLPTMFRHFDVVSFDNLALEQLRVKDILTDEEWDRYYQGDEGSSTFYLDLVDEKFGVSSLCSPEEMHPLLGSVKEMFDVVRKETKAS